MIGAFRILYLLFLFVCLFVYLLPVFLFVCLSSCLVFFVSGFEYTIFQ